MITVTGNIFDIPKINDSICIYTNGVINNYGLAVIKDDVACTADEMYELSAILGKKIFKEGNHVYLLKSGINDNGLYRIFSFPTKEHWKMKDDMEIIKRSCEELKELCIKHSISTCYMPRCDKESMKTMSDNLDSGFVFVG